MTAIPRQTHDLRISHIAYDRVHTTADDSGTWFPLPQLRRLASARRIGEVAPRFFGAPTNRSHRVTIETDAPEILARCKADNVDAAVLVPNCPVCHQTISLVARHLEANGISTVVMGCAKDIVEHAAVPRFLFSDFPLGNSAGKPHDPRRRPLPWSWRCGCWKPPRARRPRCSRRCAGARMPPGSATTATPVP